MITATHIQIEHWIPQKGEYYPDITQEQCDKLAIDYRNMLGACPGGAGRAYKYTTCDEHRDGDFDTMGIKISILLFAKISQKQWLFVHF